ncbi:conjugated bile salt MFS transporter [Intestinibacter bartlettii]|uniref:conjugated bile salt MFS transporter n=1 Tax=Intestinibacter bartlettii TaxID=261299 RepID=UPI001D025843|nr:conjugated bile salt MFS transporter [Intestinibacter bartlettii]MDU1254039.1 conjugated bile salt MFS transporter [Peptostreptococcaceae bacterium]MCB5745539.1 conjugated bile salt MFS transporter [Intestinibacter bartlettii]MDU2694150.1 conjugated bile salt MFS transporter [Intestinibacter bartlettii]MDU4257582.1 conjugated bile salt MFS transporter [Intestinibacter bartlettii]MDU6197898.1 conjugated bile salt MFS transporter [Intestinibacter bartlettii]
MGNQTLSTNNKIDNKKKYFIVFICMFLQTVPYSIAQNIQPLFVPYVIKQFGFSLAGFSLIFTCGAIASAIFSPVLGNVFEKVNIKLLFLLGATLSAVGFMGFGFSHNLAQFYVLAAMQKVGCLLFSGIGVPYLINSWFPKEGRGKALGIVFSGGSIGNVFLQQITSQMLASRGVTYSYIFFGVLALVCSLPVVMIFVRLPKAGEVEVVEENEAEEVQTSGFDGLGAKATKKNKYFWLFSIGYAIIAVSISALSTQYATYFTGELGLSATLVGTLGSVFAAFCLIGNVSGGALFDKIGTLKTMTISMLLQGVAIVALIFCAKVPALAFLFSIAYGLNVYSYMSAPAFMATDVFGKKESSKIFGTISLLFALGYAFGSTLVGMIVDKVGFGAAWIVMLGCVVVGYTLLLGSIKKVKEQYAEMEVEI